MIEQAAFLIGGFIVGVITGVACASFFAASLISEIDDMKSVNASYMQDIHRRLLRESCLLNEIKYLKKNLSRKHQKRGKGGKFIKQTKGN